MVLFFFFVFLFFLVLCFFWFLFFSLLFVMQKIFVCWSNVCQRVEFLHLPKVCLDWHAFYVHFAHARAPLFCKKNGWHGNIKFPCHVPFLFVGYSNDIDWGLKFIGPFNRLIRCTHLQSRDAVAPEELRLLRYPKTIQTLEYDEATVVRTKSDFLDWHMSDEWNPFKVVRSQHDESNTFFEKGTAGYSMRVQWSDESPHPRVGQTQRDLLDGRTADCEGKRLMGLLEGCEVGTSWFCLNTKDPHTLCKDFEKGPWDTSWSFRTLSVYFGSTCILIVQSHMWGGGRVWRKDGLPLILGLSFQYRLMADSMALRLSMWQYTTI